MKITFQSPPKNLDEKMVYNILRDYKMLNCEVLVRDDEGIFTSQYSTSSPDTNDLESTATVDDLIDVIMKDHRKYIRWFVQSSLERE